ncbi:MAG: cytochrome P450, partial [Sphingomonadaceae bacterium]
EDSEIAGQAVAKGDWVVLFQESANRDETVFADPFRFDISRRPNPHLGFGHGIHNCLGRMLAMLEVRVMIRTMLARTERIEVIGPLDRTSSTIAKGLSRMPVRVAWRTEPLQKVA